MYVSSMFLPSLRYFSEFQSWLRFQPGTFTSADVLIVTEYLWQKHEYIKRIETGDARETVIEQNCTTVQLLVVSLCFGEYV